MSCSRGSNVDAQAGIRAGDNFDFKDIQYLDSTFLKDIFNPKENENEMNSIEASCQRKTPTSQKKRDLDTGGI